MPRQRNVDPVVAKERASKAGKARTTTDYYIKKLVDDAPPLTAEQRDRLAALLRPTSADLPDEAA